jgi:DNA-binding CsgD family transcriptional regulator
MTNSLMIDEALFYKSQSVLINAIGTGVFFNSLSDCLSAIVDIQSSSAILYSTNSAPKLLFSQLQENEESLFYARFLDGAYVASPAYQGFINNYPDNMYPWSTLMPRGFKESQMFDAYYRASEIEDLVYFFINNGQQGHIQFCLGRHRPNKTFSKNDLFLLETLSELIIALIRKHYQIIADSVDAELTPLSTYVSDRVNYLLNNFESEQLTMREREIAKLVITGHSSQSAADVLGISPGTERVHRTKLYAKLKLRSNSELFSLFLNKLTILN